jgi:hypothetical protein
VLQLIALAGLAVSALVRVGFAFEIDALTIAGLSGLLFWVQFSEWRRTRRLAKKVDQLLARTRYGPLTTEDLEAIRALRAEAARLSLRPGPAR